MSKKHFVESEQTKEAARARYELAKKIAKERREAAEAFDKEFGIAVNASGFGVRHFSV